MIVCICHRVSDRDIARVAREGCASFEEMQFELSVATGCGRCHDCARGVFEQHAAAARGGPGGACPGVGPHAGPTRLPQREIVALPLGA